MCTLGLLYVHVLYSKTIRQSGNYGSITVGCFFMDSSLISSCVLYLRGLNITIYGKNNNITMYYLIKIIIMIPLFYKLFITTNIISYYTINLFLPY